MVGGYVLASVVSGRRPRAISRLPAPVAAHVKEALESLSTVDRTERERRVQSLTSRLRPPLTSLPSSPRARALLAPHLRGTLKELAAPSPLPRRGYAASPRLCETVYRAASRAARDAARKYGPPGQRSAAGDPPDERLRVLAHALGPRVTPASDAATGAFLGRADTHDDSPAVRAGRELRELLEAGCLDHTARSARSE
jgi:hypothetical protein